MVYSFILFNRLSEPAGVTVNYPHQGLTLGLWGVPGERTSGRLSYGSKHFGTTHRSPSNQFPETKQALVGKCFEMAGHCESCTISLMGSGFHQIECSAMPFVPHGRDVSERSSCQLQK